MKQPYDALWCNATLFVDAQAGLQENAALAVKDGKIAWLGKTADLPMDKKKFATQIYDVNHQLLTPGLIDCHTHLIFAGNRAHEFEWRLQGKSYAEIAKQGGGIQSTVNATRKASEEDLFLQSLPRAKSLMQSGVTTLEIKSGYGLDWETEKKMLRVAARIEATLGITVKKTFLGAHTIPLEYKQHADDYVDLICTMMIPEVAAEKLADAVDVFCETIAFTRAQTEKIFAAAKQHHLQIKCHAEQLSDSDAAALAAQYHALSVDHLEFISPAGIAAIAKSKTVAVLLPGAFYFLREKKSPPVALLQQHNVPIAIASDCNPGTSPVLSLPLVMNMACVLFNLTPLQALQAVTQHAAQALGLGATHGSLSVGKMADFAIWDCDHPAELAYYIGGNALTQLISGGQSVFEEVHLSECDLDALKRK